MARELDDVGSAGGEEPPERRAYGSHLASCFRLPELPTHVTRTLRRGLLAATDLQNNVPMPGLTDPLGYDDAFVVGVQLKAVPDHELWLNGRPIHVEPFEAGATTIYDLRQDPRAVVRQPARPVLFYVPLATMNQLAEQHDLRAISDLAYTPGIGQDNSTLRNLAQAVLSAFEVPLGANGLFLDQLLWAVCAHVLEQYGSTRATLRRATGGLTPWQERRAKELMNDRLAEDLSIAELADECRLSVTHFARAFRQSTGTSPHQWLLGRRIDKAMSLLAQSDLTLAEIAVACGFSDQSHFTRVFSGNVGVTPGRWRRSHT